MKHNFEDGKYTVEFDRGTLKALRNGEPWRDLTGDKLVYVMLAEVDRLRAEAIQRDYELTEYLRLKRNTVTILE